MIRATRREEFYAEHGVPPTKYAAEPMPYKFFFAHVLMRSSAFSMFSIELATLKRK